jgi:hypothetical protein
MEWRIFENRVLKRIFRYEKNDVTEDGGNYLMSHRDIGFSDFVHRPDFS